MEGLLSTGPTLSIFYMSHRSLVRLSPNLGIIMYNFIFTNKFVSC